MFWVLRSISFIMHSILSCHSLCCSILLNYHSLNWAFWFKSLHFIPCIIKPSDHFKPFSFSACNPCQLMINFLIHSQSIISTRSVFVSTPILQAKSPHRYPGCYYYIDCFLPAQSIIFPVFPTVTIIIIYKSAANNTSMISWPRIHVYCCSYTSRFPVMPSVWQNSKTFPELFEDLMTYKSMDLQYL